MSFATWAALAALLLAVVPVAAHLLRRRKAEQQPFPAAAIVPPSPPAARRRSNLEDRPLLALRVLAVIALALLGASPLVRCSRLSLGRKAGGSVALAIVIDDSMSMRAADGGSRSRFEKARKDASDLLASAQEGDAIGVILAGWPPRLMLAPTTDLKVAAHAVDQCAPSDRATDLDGAIALARSTLQDLPQADKRIVVLTDRADGHPEAPPLGDGVEVPVWIPGDGAEPKLEDCAIIRADHRQAVVAVRIACSGAAPARGRSIEARNDGRAIASRTLPALEDAPVAIADFNIDLKSPSDHVDSVVLTGPADAIAHDDSAPVGMTSASLAIAVISDRGSQVVTGGPPPVEQAIDALESGASVRPLPVTPETADELSAYAALIIDDPPGLTPEARRAIATWLDKGGVALVAIGPRAASALIGATFEPFFPGAARWDTKPPAGCDPATAAMLGTSLEGLAELHPQGRGMFDNGPASGMEHLVNWTDGAAFLARRRVGRGTAYTLSVPLSADQSDFVIRPAFLALLETIIDNARARSSSRRIDVGAWWTFDPNQDVQVRDQQGPVPVELAGDRKRVTPAVAERYDLHVDGQSETRFAMIPERELDVRVRRVSETATHSDLGATSSKVDVSRYVALVLLALLASEMIARAAMRAREGRLEAR